MFGKKELESKKYQLPPAMEPFFLTSRVDEYYRERVTKTWNGGHIMKGQEPGERSILLVSNDYLNLARHPRVMQVQASALKNKGHGLLRSDVFRGKTSAFHRLEEGLAELTDADAAMITQSGWCANVGLFQSIATASTPIYLDMYAHTSLWEGVRSAGARAYPFKHNDPASLERLIEKYGPGVIGVDAVYSTSGSIAPLKDFADVSARKGCLLVVDESHSLGVFGDHGEGLCAAQGLAYRVHFRTASLSKAFASRGGLILGSSRNIEYLRYESRPAIFSSGMLQHEAEGLLEMLKVVAQSNWRRGQLQKNADYLRQGLSNLDYNVEESESQIISLVAGPEQQTILLRNALEARGVFGSVFCAPATAKNHSLVRFSVHSALKKEHLDRIIQVCGQIRSEVGMRDWASTRKRQKLYSYLELAETA